jgi:homoserine kinase
VAACVLGSVVASAIDSHGMTRAVRLELPGSLGMAVVVPDFPLPTHEARAALPQSYSRADAVFNVQRSALLMAALATGNHSAFPAALEDRLHQPYRQKLVPGLEEILKLRAPGLLGCCLSGAGPSVLVFFEIGHAAVVEHVRQIFAAHGHRAEVLDSQVDAAGIQLTEWEE